MTLLEILTDIRSLEEELLGFERKYGLNSEAFFAAYSSGEEPEDDREVLNFSEWASLYRTRCALQALVEIRSTKLTNEEDAVLEEFESFRRKHPFSLASLDED